MVLYADGISRRPRLAQRDLDLQVPRGVRTYQEKGVTTGGDKEVGRGGWWIRDLVIPTERNKG